MSTDQLSTMFPSEYRRRYSLENDIYGKVRAALEQQGTPIAPLDSLIAAHAKSLDMTLVTNNTREFKRVEGLKIEDWASE